MATDTAHATTSTNGEHVQGLLPHHLDELRASGLTDETIRQAGIYSEANYQRLASILDWRNLPKRMAPGLVYPFGNNGYARIKFDNPRRSAGNLVKYESPRGRPNKVYVPPGVANIFDDATARLFITEGEKKSLAATQAGFLCVGLVGVFGWKDGKREQLLPDLDAIRWQGRQVLIAFDSDVATNANVLDAESRLAAHLKRRGANVRCVRLPGDDDAKVGLDDYLVANGAAAFEKLLSEAVEPEAPAAVEMLPEAAALDPATEAAEIIDTARHEGERTLRFWRGTFWRWSAGRYVELTTSDVRGRAVKSLNKRWRRLTTQAVANVMMQIQAQSLLSADTQPPTWLGKPPVDWKPDEILATRDALVHLPSLVTGNEHSHPATPRYFSITATEFSFDPQPPAPSTWLRFLGELWPDDAQSIAALQMWFGYLLTADTRHHKILMLIGPTRSGKGTIARVLRALVGAQNVAGPTLSGLGSQFGLAPLIGKSLAIISDARLWGRADQASIVERLLSVSGEDCLTIDRKHLEPVTCILPTRLMLLSNELPRLGDASGALTGRMILLRLTESWLGREDKHLTEKLMGELPGILAWAIGGWHRLREDGRFIQPDSALELLGELSDLSSPIGQFIRERCTVEPGLQVAVADLYAEWKAWAEKKGRREPGTEQTFGRDLLAAVPNIRRTRPRESGERIRCYEGIGIRD